jgi:hypothetical protein
MIAQPSSILATITLPFIFGCASIANAAIPEACLNLTVQATYIESEQIICLQQIEVTGGENSRYYKAALKWMGNERNEFQLVDAVPDEKSSETETTYSPASGILNIPKIDIPKTFGTERYSAVMNFNNTNRAFVLSEINIYDNPDHIPNKTWKPYTNLGTDERRAVDLLGESLTYAKLAQSIYNFDNKHVDSWKLIHQRSKDSGMQAGVYKNEGTGDIVLAFRGTTDGSEEKEPCDGFINCAIDTIKDPFTDLISDISLVFGNDNDQFRHAFDYAEDVVAFFPTTNIVVTGHSLGGGLAQATGTTFGLKTFAFNSAPVPDSFFKEHSVALTEEERNNTIHIISDIHDPVSNNKSVNLYVNADHVTRPISFNFDTKEVLPEALKSLDDLRFNKHGIGKLVDNSSELLTVYRDGW